ncbi:MAG: hypothetical protein GEV28_13650 [Actinophytocola sp.]|uniref:hypothetical protein n=1 Tax=Actinophytocola sp. TaxID=1872138 RepID=UPI00132072FE|nr:hypothetical protein [Actinophytocola sp.]MPZ81381.1 hypothetical protein [Actinophytocola sp.]
MGRRTTDGAPGARGWLLGSCSAALAVAAHGTAGGTLSDAALTALLTTVLAWGGATIVRRGGLVALVGVLGTTQAAQHVLLTEIAGSMHTHMLAPPPVNGWLMFATHAVATLLSAVLLLRADEALAAVGAAFTWLVGRLQALCPAPPRAALQNVRGGAPARPDHLLEVLLRRVSPRRGPPVRS